MRRGTEQKKKIIVSNSGPIANYLVDEASGERKKVVSVDCMSRLSHCGLPLNYSHTRYKENIV